MLSRAILPAISRVISVTLPERFWYRAALLTSATFSFAVLIQKAKPSPRRYEQAIVLNTLLAFLTRFGKPFPVPWRMDAASAAVLDAAVASAGGLILCSAHLPLIKVAVRAFLETRQLPCVAIAARPDPDDCIPVWGIVERLPAFKAQSNVLLRVRTELRAKRSVLLLVDKPSGDYSPNIFRLASATGATVLFFTTELEPGGCVSVRVFAAPCPACRDQDEIASNLLALDGAVKAISHPAEQKRFDSVPAGRLT